MPVDRALPLELHFAEGVTEEYDLDFSHCGCNCPIILGDATWNWLTDAAWLQICTRGFQRM
jgi:hypothetical protein